MTGIRGLGFLILLIPAVVTAAPFHPLSAQLELREAFAQGVAETEGEAWALSLVADPQGPAPGAALLALEADRVLLREDYRDYYGTPLGIFGKETHANQEEHVLDAARLLLHEARADVRFLIVPNDASMPMQAAFASTEVRLADGIDASLRPELPGVEAPPEMQHTYQRAGAVVRLTTQSPQEAIVLSGDFFVFLWDIDLRDASDGSTLYRSGVERRPGLVQTPQTPMGVLYEARAQLLTLEVSHGRITFSVPERTLDTYYEPGALRVASGGSWDVLGARGLLDWGGGRNLLRESTLHLEGRFDTKLGLGEDPGGLQSDWSGEAAAVRAGDLDLAAADSVVPASNPSWTWLWVLGAAVVGTGGLAVYRVRRPESSPGRRLVQPIEKGDYRSALANANRALGRGAPNTDALMTKGIALLKLGRAADVVKALEPSFDDAHPVAAVQAYLLSVAHLQLGDREKGIGWILQSADLYPDFAREIPVNEAFASIRNDLRIRKLVGQQEDPIGYA